MYWATDKHLQCDRKAWVSVHWVNTDIPAPATVQQGVLPLRIKLRRRRWLDARPSYIWAKNCGEFLSIEEWAEKAQIGEAYNLDNDLLMSPEEMEGCRKALRMLGKSVWRAQQHHNADNLTGIRISYM